MRSFIENKLVQNWYWGSTKMAMRVSRMIMIDILREVASSHTHFWFGNQNFILDDFLLIQKLDWHFLISDRIGNDIFRLHHTLHFRRFIPKVREWKFAKHSDWLAFLSLSRLFGYKYSVLKRDGQNCHTPFLIKSFANPFLQFDCFLLYNSTLLY